MSTKVLSPAVLKVAGIIAAAIGGSIGAQKVVGAPTPEVPAYAPTNWMRSQSEDIKALKADLASYKAALEARVSVAESSIVASGKAIDRLIDRIDRLLERQK